jgi:hypothetical protein
MAISGVWYNRIGSELRLETEGDMVYGTFVAHGDGGFGEYKVTGRLNNDPSHSGAAVGFVVVWHNGYINRQSVTSWCGQYQINNDREEITAAWLLKQVTVEPEDWHSTLIGYDVFLRQQPTAEEAAMYARRGQISHPPMRREGRPSRRGG